MFINKDIRDIRHFFKDMNNILNYLTYAKINRGTYFFYKAEKIFSGILCFSLILWLFPHNLLKKNRLKTGMKNSDFFMFISYIALIVLAYFFFNISIITLLISMGSLIITSLVLSMGMEFAASIVSIQKYKWFLRKNRLAPSGVVKSKVMQDFLRETNLKWDSGEFIAVNFDKFIEWKNKNGGSIKKENLLYLVINEQIAKKFMIFSKSVFFQKMNHKYYMLMINIDKNIYDVSVLKNAIGIYVENFGGLDGIKSFWQQYKKGNLSEIDKEIWQILKGFERENFLRQQMLENKDGVKRNKKPKI